MFTYEKWDFDPEIPEIVQTRLNTNNSHNPVYGEVSYQTFSKHSHYVNASCRSAFHTRILHLAFIQYQSDNGMKSGLGERGSKDLRYWTCVPSLAT